MNKIKDSANFAISFLLAALIVFYIITVAASPQFNFDSVLRFLPNGISFFGKEYYLREEVSVFFRSFSKIRDDFYDMLVFPPARDFVKKSAASVAYAAEELIISINDIVYFVIHGNM